MRTSFKRADRNRGSPKLAAPGVYAKSRRKNCAGFHFESLGFQRNASVKGERHEPECLLTGKKKPHNATLWGFFEFFSAPDRIRTCDLRLRRPTLYPAELRARMWQGGE
jgi:hypothetical protein